MLTSECQELSILVLHTDLTRSIVCSQGLHGEMRGQLDFLFVDDIIDTIDKINEVVVAFESPGF